MHENLVVPNPVPDLEYLQGHFTDMMKRRLKVSKGSTLKVHKDASFTENPMERQDVEEALKVTDSIPHQCAILCTLFICVSTR